MGREPRPQHDESLRQTIANLKDLETLCQTLIDSLIHLEAKVLDLPANDDRAAFLPDQTTAIVNYVNLAIEQTKSTKSLIM